MYVQMPELDQACQASRPSVLIHRCNLPFLLRFAGATGLEAMLYVYRETNRVDATHEKPMDKRQMQANNEREMIRLDQT
jgi:hypothetical protein